MNPSRITITATVSLAIGILTARCYSVAFFVLFIILILLFTLCITFLYYKKRNLAFAILMIFTACIGSIGYKYKNEQMEGRRLRFEKGDSASITGQVVEPPVLRRGRPEFVIRITGVNGDSSIESKNSRAIVKCRKKAFEAEGALNFEAGNTVSFNGIYTPPDKATNPGQFDYGGYLELNGISAVFTVDDVNAINVTGNFNLDIFSKTAFSVRKHTAEIIYSSMPYPESALMSGIVLGTTNDLPDKMLDDFRISGVVHILAASGFNISVVISFFVIVLHFFGLKKNYYYLLPIPAVILYLLVAGGSPSIVRAAFMGIIFLTATAVNKDYDPLYSLFVAGFFMLLANPFILFMAGFQLSFVVTGGILMLYPVLDGLFPADYRIRDVLKKRFGLEFAKKAAFLYRFVLSAVLVTTAAQAAVIPILSIYFNRISLVNIAANLIVTPVATISLPAGFFGSFTGYLWPDAGRAVAALMYFPLKLTSGIISALACVPFASFPVPAAGPAFLIPYWLLFLAFTVRNNFVRRYRYHVALVIAAFASFCLFSAAMNVEKQYRLVVFDTESIRCMFMKQGRQGMLAVVARSGEKRNDAFELSSSVMPAIRADGFPTLAALFVLGEKGARLPNLDAVFSECKPQVVFIDSVFCDDPSLPGFLLQAEKTGVMVYSGYSNYKIEPEKGNIRLCFDRSRLLPLMLFQSQGNRLLLYDGSVMNSDTANKMEIKSGDVVVLTDTGMENLLQLEKKVRNISDLYVILLTDVKTEKMSEGIPWYKKKFLMETLNETGKLLTPSKDGSVILDLSGPIPHRVPQHK
ncbi:MAG: ComEC family competence protein [Firmicutes bacterium]|nr:ComEC family competence protein [Bacillota bacterium]